ncbi:hypothetical protein [Saccharopolyspora elongata]|uniref:Uncharacterized protein n=1 Tax=Saccharopolyspora elongata TaxID=2530387 RepID=A0A4R4YBD7_9PSEU|nr:hypothetical protein [Saccharopolyspora elongata]TDD41360.1 hypothetical protein E1288_32805 [Saccharopolyspora elongata]
MFTEAACVALATLVAGGWLTFDSATVNWIVTGVGLLASAVFATSVRRRVTSVAAAISAQGFREDRST